MKVFKRKEVYYRIWQLLLKSSSGAKQAQIIVGSLKF